MDSVSAKKSKKIRHNTAFTTREMVLAGMFAAVLAVISWLRRIHPPLSYRRVRIPDPSQIPAQCNANSYQTIWSSP